MNYSVRKPTEQEIIEIADFLKNHKDYKDNFKGDEEVGISAKQVIESYYTMVLENYHSDCPSYCGIVYMIIWGEVCYITQIIRDKETGKLELSEIQV